MNGRRSRSTEVILNVYDLTPMNEWGHSFGLGAYHSGVQIDGREYTYAGGGGIFDHDPRKAPGALFREAVSMGSFVDEPGTLGRALDVLRDEFRPDRYNVLTRNCNTFSSAICEELLGKPIPGYVNRLAWLGSWFSCLVPPHMLGEAPVNSAGSYGSGYQMIAPPGRSTTQSGRRSAGSGGGYSAFSGSGLSLAGGPRSSGKATSTSTSSGSREAELSDRRERMRAAALRRAEAEAAAAAASATGASSSSAKPS